MHQSFLICFAVSCLTFTTGPAIASTGDCYLRVSGKVYLDERCNVVVDKGGNFTIGVTDEPPRSKYFAYVNNVNAATGKGDGFWNGPPAASHAQWPLGELTRQGGCWFNATAKVCAWKLGTKPDHF